MPDQQPEQVDVGAWERIEPTIVTQVGWRTIVSKTFRMPNGKIHHLETISPEGRTSAGCVALTPDNKVIVVKQFRPGRERVLWEIPGGSTEPDEDLADAAKREMLEEAGYIPGHMELLGAYGWDAYTNAVSHYYLATDCTPSPEGQKLDATEFGEVCLISIDEFIQNARTDQMTDVAAVLMAYDQLLARKEK